MTGNDPTTYDDDGADLTADGGDVLSAAERESLARTIYEASDAYDFDGVAWEHQYGATKREAYAQADAVLAARAAAAEEAAAVRAENARLREQVDLERFKYEHAHKGAIYADRAHVAEARIAQRVVDGTPLPWTYRPTTAHPEPPSCLRCEAPIYLDGEVWRRESTGSDYCPRNPASDCHEPLTATQPEQGGAS